MSFCKSCGETSWHMFTNRWSDYCKTCKFLKNYDTAKPSSKSKSTKAEYIKNRKKYKYYPTLKGR